MSDPGSLTKDDQLTADKMVELLFNMAQRTYPNAPIAMISCLWMQAADFIQKQSRAMSEILELANSDHDGGLTEEIAEIAKKWNTSASSLESTDRLKSLHQMNLEAIADLQARLAKPSHEREPPHCSTCGCGLGPPPQDALRDVIAERARQISVEGWTTTHDDAHCDFSMATAAACYAAHAANRGWLSENEYQADKAINPGESQDTPAWPKHWDKAWFKPSSPRRDLVKAAALILAEIERIDRGADLDTTKEGFIRIGVAATKPASPAATQPTDCDCPPEKIHDLCNRRICPRRWAVPTKESGL